MLIFGICLAEDWVYILQCILGGIHYLLTDTSLSYEVTNNFARGFVICTKKLDVIACEMLREIFDDTSSLGHLLKSFTTVLI